jgi:septation ring formation regulator EzrA
MDNDNFKSKLYSFMYQAVRVGSSSGAVGGIEKLRNSTDEIAKLIRELIIYEAGEIGNKIQEALKTPFKTIEKDVEALEGRVDELQEEVAKLWMGGDSKKKEEEE